MARICYPYDMAAPFEQQLAAIAEVAERRQKAQIWGFVLTFAVGLGTAVLLGIPIDLLTMWPFVIGAIYLFIFAVPIFKVVDRLTDRYVDEAAAKFGVPKEQLVADLEIGKDPST